MLVYLYFSSIWHEGQFKNTMESNRLMIDMCKNIRHINHNLVEEIHGIANFSGDTTLRPQINAVLELMKQEEAFDEYKSSIQQQLWGHCGGRFSEEEPQRMLRYKYYFPYKNFFDAQKNREIKEKMIDYLVTKNKIIDKLNIGNNPQVAYSSMLSDSTLGERFQYYSPLHALYKLNELIFEAQMIDKQILELYIERISRYKPKDDCYKDQLDIVFEPINYKKLDPLEGYFKVVKTTPLCQERKFDCLANGKKVLYKDGKAYVKYKPQKLGENEIFLKLKLKNTSTGDSLTMNGGHIFNVK